MKTAWDDTDLYNEALAAMLAYCEEKHLIFQQPSVSLSEIGRKYVHLRNANGLIAKYDIQNKTIIAGA